MRRAKYSHPDTRPRKRHKLAGQSRSKQIMDDFPPLAADFNTESTVETTGARIHESCKGFVEDDSEEFGVPFPGKSAVLGPETNSQQHKKMYGCYRKDYRKAKGKRKNGTRYGNVKRKEKEWSKIYKNSILEYKRDVLDQPSDSTQKTPAKPDPQVKLRRKVLAGNDVFSLDNMLYTSNTKKIQASRTQQQIQVPQFKVLAKSFYFLASSEKRYRKKDEDFSHSAVSEEDDSDLKYQELHKPCEEREEKDKPPLEFK